MIIELAMMKDKNKKISEKLLDHYVQAFYDHVKTNYEGMVTKSSFYHYYKSK